MPSHHTLAKVLKRLLYRRANSHPLRGTWRDTQASASLPRGHAALTQDMPPGLYRSEAFAEDLCDNKGLPG